jgi:hypothetical protein
LRYLFWYTVELKRNFQEGYVNKIMAEDLVAKLLSSAAGLMYGCVSVSVKLHEGRIVQVLYSTTENTKEQVAKGGGEK